MSLKTFVDLQNLSEAEIHGQFGGKAWGLFVANQQGIRVPQTWLISADWYSKFFTANPNLNKKEFITQAQAYVTKHFSEDIAALSDVEFAVRSSSQFEDTATQSFAGIFESKLHVKKENLAKAVAEVWASCLAERVVAYFDDLSDLRMSVIIQPMIAAKYAGVCFSKHPSAISVFENHYTLIEVAQAEGEKIVQGEITPFRFSGNLVNLITTIDADWIAELINAVIILKRTTQHEIDMEFVVDQRQDFYLVQQRPVSTDHVAKTLDLSIYHRAYKRTLWCLDIEMLIEGCSLFLSGYLEIPYALDLWMVMITNPQGTQELWLHKLIDQAVIQQVAENILTDEHYLSRIAHRYAMHHKQILQYDYSIFVEQNFTLEQRFLNWIDFIRPLHAHYYVPMFMIDALSQLLMRQMQRIDSKNAEGDLLKLGTLEVRTLGDFLTEALWSFRQELREERNFSQLSTNQQRRLQELSKKFGFLKCHQVYESGYTPEEFFTMALELEEKPEVRSKIELEKLYEKYITNGHTAYIFEQFKHWMNIRNQQMEYLMYAVLQSRPLMEEIGQTLNLTVKQLWGLSREIILESIRHQNNLPAKSFSANNLSIYRENGKTHVTNELKIIYATTTQQKVIKGKVIYGEGKITAKVKLAFKPEDLQNFAPGKNEYVLVAGMTTPDFVPYLKNFVALVTDEGGILCHAAIIARETHIPAIVGSGVATEILKNDMQITLDLDRGEIVPD